MFSDVFCKQFSKQPSYNRLNKENKKIFLKGLKKAIDTIELKSIIIYGFVTEKI